MKKLVILATVLFLFAAGTADGATVGNCLSEDFSGTPGADLTTKGWPHYSGDTLLLTGNTIDLGNSGDWQESGSYGSYRKALSSATGSLTLGQQYIIQGSFEFASTPPANEWWRVTDSFDEGTLIGLGMDFQMNGTATSTLSSVIGGAGFGGSSQYDIGLLSTNTLYDARIVITEGGVVDTDDTISWEWKARSSSTWNVVATRTGSFVSQDTAMIDHSGGYNGFIDTISVDVIPEPATLALLLLGGLAMLRRRGKS